VAILFPIAAFVAIGFEHSIASWFFLPFGLAVDAHGSVVRVQSVSMIRFDSADYLCAH